MSKITKIRATLLCFAFYIPFSVVYAQPGTLDASCGINGIVSMNMFTNGTSQSEDYIRFVKSNSSKIYVGGGASDPFASSYSTGFLVARLNSDGSPDTTFGNDGKVLVHVGSWMDGAHSILISPAGIILSGFTASLFGSKVALIRLDSSGSLDPSFGNGGKVILNVPSNGNATKIVEQSDGKLLISGYMKTSSYGSPKAFLARLLANGALDTSFGVSGIVSEPFGTNISSSEIMTMEIGTFTGIEKIVVAGWSNIGGLDRFSVSRINLDGSLDTSFNGTGTSDLIIPIAGGAGSARATSVSIKEDNVYVAGTVNDSSGSASRVVVANYNSQGSLNTDFAQAGMYIVNYDSTPNSTAHLVINTPTLVVTGTRVDSGQYGYSATRLFLEGGNIDDRFGWMGDSFIPISLDPAYTHIFSNMDSDSQFTVGYIFNGTFYPGVNRILIAGKSVVNGSTDLILAAMNRGGCK